MAIEEINITIAGKSFKLNVDSSKRELYNLAQQRVNDAIVKFEKRSYEGLRLQDAISLAAFEFAISNISLRQQTEVDSEETTILKALDKRVEEYLNDLSAERKK